MVVLPCAILFRVRFVHFLCIRIETIALFYTCLQSPVYGVLYILESRMPNI